MELKKHYTNEQTGIRYSLHGDFYLPDIKVPEENIVLGKWGMLYKDYLSNNKKVVFSVRLAEGITEQLKEQDQLEWVQRMGNIQHRATKIVCDELIYV